MEVKSVVECFHFSEAAKSQDRKLKYTKLIDDGNSEAYPSILATDSYPETVIEKLQFIGHIQKIIDSKL